MWSLRSLQNLLDLGQTSVHDLRMTVATNQSLDSSLYSNEGEARWHRGLRCHIFHIVVRRGSSQVMTLPTCPGRGAKGEADGLQIFHCHYSAVLLRFDNFAKPKRWINEVSRMFFFYKSTFDKHLVLLSSTSTLVQKERERVWVCRAARAPCVCRGQYDVMTQFSASFTTMTCTLYSLTLKSNSSFSSKEVNAYNVPWCVEQDPSLTVTYGGEWCVASAWCLVCSERAETSPEPELAATGLSSVLSYSGSDSCLPHWHSSAAARLLPAAIRHLIPETRREQER